MLILIRADLFVTQRHVCGEPTGGGGELAVRLKRACDAVLAGAAVLRGANCGETARLGRKRWRRRRREADDVASWWSEPGTGGGEELHRTP